MWKGKKDLTSDHPWSTYTPTWKSYVICECSLDEASDDVIAKQFVFAIGTEVIKELRNKESKLSIEVIIHDLKGETKNEDVESGVEDESYVTINNVKEIKVIYFWILTTVRV